ncbi:type II secretion system GspH family protein [Shewanella sp. AS1]|uniref:pilus assembly FimT family protein n=1 Tax=Shewanella sp. AS1 TaxID=2907626 RepID=UPI001F31EAFC|nr:type II secretion system protein [Shewanella sp. AS1]MCE9679790.1 type II secretion system GspH family protein [Shewanella sp. AS1]
MAKQQGFTLVELVTTMVLISILAVVVLPRFFSASAYSAYTLRDELIGELRRVQLMALNNQDRCYGVKLTPNDYRMMIYRSDCSTVLVSGTPQSLPRQTSVTLSGSQDFNLMFNQEGAILPQCANTCVVKVSADESLDLIIESQGYIHGR